MKIVLAYSGELDAPVLISWLKEKNKAGFKLDEAGLPFHQENK